ncbi:Domain of uncharacterised function (DUF932) [Klebsiella pneumoniae]|nr:prophage protein [Klebsiella pneumoniae]SXL10096.1 Domain of uncharacterised function (DUF932) [Klebsiella pneumoniae]VGF99350.1 Domain of uncharacterised function (DUF932) [Klebsiella pneumoniae]
MRLASRFGRVNQIRRDRPLTHEELMQHVPSVFGEDKHDSRSEKYTYIPTITLLENLKHEGFQPFFACQSRVRDQSRWEHTKHMLRLRRAGQKRSAGAGNHHSEFARWRIKFSVTAGDISKRLHQFARLRTVVWRDPRATQGRRCREGD